MSKTTMKILRNSPFLLTVSNDFAKPCMIPFVQANVSISYKNTQLQMKNHIKNHFASRKQFEPKKAQLVIFDKDGTLTCFNSMWVPWVINVANRINSVTGLELHNKVYNLLGFNPVDKRVRPGLLASATMKEITDDLIRFLVTEGTEMRAAKKIIVTILHEQEYITAQNVKQIYDLKYLFEQLRRNCVKIAICTSDSRRRTVETIHYLGVESYIDYLMCGDDPESIPKPNPQNALTICRNLNVDPQWAIMVGDTLSDLDMGKAARVGSTVGVLSGVCDINDLSPSADLLVAHVGELMPIVLDMNI